MAAGELGGRGGVGRAAYAAYTAVAVLASLHSIIADAATAAPGSRFSNSTAAGVRREGVDMALRQYAFLRLSGRARTGVVYDVALPPSLRSALNVTALVIRVRSGSARRRGLVVGEFRLPKGLRVVSGGPFVVMVYRKLLPDAGSTYSMYTLPPPYQFASPLVGIVVYTSVNTSSFHDQQDLPEMNVVAPLNSPITATLTPFPPSSGNVRAFMCAFFDVNGTLTIANTSSPHVCSSQTLLDVALVSPSPSANATATGPPPPPPPLVTISQASADSSNNAWKYALAAVLGGVVGMSLLFATLAMAARTRAQHGAPFSSTKVPSNNNNNFHEALQTSIIGHTRAPTASGVRTKPSLETGSLRSPTTY